MFQNQHPLTVGPTILLLLVGGLFLLFVCGGLITGIVLLMSHRRGSEMSCGACGYNTKGLSELSCPECGADLREVGIVSSGSSRLQTLGLWLTIGCGVLLILSCCLSGVFFGVA